MRSGFIYAVKRAQNITSLLVSAAFDSISDLVGWMLPEGKYKMYYFYLNLTRIRRKEYYGLLMLKPLWKFYFPSLQKVIQFKKLLFIRKKWNNQNIINWWSHFSRLMIIWVFVNYLSKLLSCVLWNKFNSEIYLQNND